MNAQAESVVIKPLTITDYRQDEKTRRIIDEAITILPYFGLSRAAKYLCSYGIPEVVAMRILLHPDQ